MSRMKFGVSVEAPVEWGELLAFARRIDGASRFDALWISDALIAQPPEAPRLEAWTALAAIAQATSRVRLGVLVSGNAYRHPALLAKMVTTIDHISGGRVELGIGAGWPGENRRMGIDFGTRKERAERLDEALEVIKRLWTDDRPAFSGKHYRIGAPTYSPPNVQRPHPPIVIGGGTDAMLKIIAKHADKANPMIDVVEANAKIDVYCAKIGRDPKEIGRTLETQLFLNDDPAMQQRAVEWAMQQYGTTEEEVRKQLFGSVEEVVRGVERFAAQGIEEIMVFQVPRIHEKSLMRFSDEVIPPFADAPARL